MRGTERWVIDKVRAHFGEHRARFPAAGWLRREGLARALGFRPSLLVTILRELERDGAIESRELNGERHYRAKL